MDRDVLRVYFGKFRCCYSFIWGQKSTRLSFANSNEQGPKIVKNTFTTDLLDLFRMMFLIESRLLILNKNLTKTLYDIGTDVKSFVSYHPVGSDCPTIFRDWIVSGDHGSIYWYLQGECLKMCQPRDGCPGRDEAGVDQVSDYTGGDSGIYRIGHPFLRCIQ